MPIDGVQNYNITARNGSLSNVIAGTVLGVAAGYAAKHVVPLDSTERSNIPYRSIINVARKETNKKMVENFNALNKHSEAQDVFINMHMATDVKNRNNIFES